MGGGGRGVVPGGDNGEEAEEEGLASGHARSAEQGASHGRDEGPDGVGLDAVFAQAFVVLRRVIVFPERQP